MYVLILQRSAASGMPSRGMAGINIQYGTTIPSFEVVTLVFIGEIQNYQSKDQQQPYI